MQDWNKVEFGKVGSSSKIGAACGGTDFTMSRSERREAQFRKRQIANAWSQLQRADRLRAGKARQAWLLNIIDHIATS